LQAATNIDWANLTFGSNAAADFIGELREMDPSVFVDGCWQRSWQNQRALIIVPAKTL
jgi:hypothetical protein